MMAEHEDSLLPSFTETGYTAETSDTATFQVANEQTSSAISPFEAPAGSESTGTCPRAESDSLDTFTWTDMDLYTAREEPWVLAGVQSSTMLHHHHLATKQLRLAQPLDDQDLSALECSFEEATARLPLSPTANQKNAVCQEPPNKATLPQASQQSALVSINNLSGSEKSDKSRPATPRLFSEESEAAHTHKKPGLFTRLRHRLSPKHKKGKKEKKRESGVPAASTATIAASPDKNKMQKKKGWWKRHFGKKTSSEKKN